MSSPGTGDLVDGVTDRGPQRIAVLALTRGGLALGMRLIAALPEAVVHAPESRLTGEAGESAETRAAGASDKANLATDAVVSAVAARCIGFAGPVRECIGSLLADCDALVAILSLGATVRLIAPHLCDKRRDPAVVVLDETGRFAVPVTGGHLGGANALARRIGRALGALPVVTTASDVLETLAVDLLGRELGWRLEASAEDLLRASAVMVNGEPVALVQEAGGGDWWRAHAGGRDGPLPSNLERLPSLEALEPDRHRALLWIAARPLPPEIAVRFAGPVVAYRQPAGDAETADADARPRATMGVRSGPRLTLGLGCDRGTPADTLERAVSEALSALGAGPGQIAAVASIDLKSDEPGLAELARQHGWTLRFFAAEALAAVPVPNPSETVRHHTGTPSVSAAAALLAAGRPAGGLRIEKHRVQGADGRHATVSVAEIAGEDAAPGDPAPLTAGLAARPPAPGKLYLVGLGPGATEHMTVRARAAIAEADTLIGHATYLRLIANLAAGKRIVKSGMTEELARARQALDLARAGQRVALISSGDAGVYGMAGPALELLIESGWTSQSDIPVEIVPGATAMTACAALAGAPLGHDFCAVSLSDLLTPWPLVARRLAAAAAADFVVALYNPRSHRRTAQIEEARRLLLALRRPDTPIALVRAAYRPEQRVVLTTLADLDTSAVDMQTTVLIGNSRTRVREGLMITPRGYGDKYDLQTGSARPGERGGRSLGGGLDVWLAEMRARAEGDAELALRFGLPVDYIAAVRGTRN
jgi:precorrin-3B C17-methyltransferase